MREAEIRLELVEAYGVFSLALINSSRKIIDPAFSQTTNEAERASLQKLLNEVLDDLDRNRFRISEIILEEQILKIVNPMNNH